MVETVAEEMSGFFAGCFNQTTGFANNIYANLLCGCSLRKNNFKNKHFYKFQHEFKLIGL